MPRARSVAAVTAGLLADGACGEDEINGPICANGCGPELSISPAEATIEVGDSVHFNLQIQAPDETQTFEVVWASSDTTAVAVDSTGTAFGRAPGTAKIKAALFSDPANNAGADLTVVDHNK